MPSASMYASPYTHKEPPPKINYPGLLDSFSKATFRYLFDSKILALSTLMLGLSFIVVVLMTVMPFWFELKFNSIDGTYGSRPKKTGLTVNSGLFYMNEQEFINLAFLNKYTGRDVVPKVLAFAQVCSVFGTCVLVCCFVGAKMLMLRRFASTTGAIFLAGAATLSAVLHVLTILFCGILLGLSSCEPDDSSCNYEDNQVWRMLPLYSQMYRVEPHVTPYVKASWAYFIAIIGCLLIIASAVLLWIEAIITAKNLTGIRYQQLREVRDPYANDINPLEGKKYIYAAPMRYGPNTFGMQPVVYASGQPPSSHAPPSIGFVTGPSKPMYRPESESGSSAQGTREIDL